MRADFSKKTRDVLAARVAYRCSYPGCSRITIGPGNEHEKHVVIVGEAAHIYAAAEKGPRPNPSLTVDQRSAISNGIWLCKAHARIIDVDTSNFSPETLLLWKRQAEKDTYQRLMELERDVPIGPQTLIGLQNSLICSGIWLSVESDNWSFLIDHYVEGDMEQLKNFSITFPEIPAWNKFILIESQGDGRELRAFSWKQTDQGSVQIFCHVAPKSPRTSPREMGADLAINENFDIFFENNDFAIVKGMDAAIQDIKIHLSSVPGDYKQSPLIGSEIVKYFDKYKGKLELLNSLVKIEIIRLLTVSVPDSRGESPTPSFNYINRIRDVSISSIDEKSKSAMVKLSLEWGNFELWEGTIKLGINKS